MKKKMDKNVKEKCGDMKMKHKKHEEKEKKYIDKLEKMHPKKRK